MHPKPLKPKLPGGRKQPTRNQRRPAPKQPWDRGREVGERVVKYIKGIDLNPFD